VPTVHDFALSAIQSSRFLFSTRYSYSQT